MLRWMYRLMDSWMGASVWGWIDGWTDGRMDRCVPGWVGRKVNG